METQPQATSKPQVSGGSALLLALHAYAHPLGLRLRLLAAGVVLLAVALWWSFRPPTFRGVSL